MANELVETVRFMATPSDRALLEEIAQQDGDASMSATIRKLIRVEAARRGIQVPTETTEPDAVLTA